ncbi:C5a anaphylatoxin chemotactic receptor 1-like [Ranitomeya variabilis]|uniref:C5a anaphylatoxin chemotactic receptor 1-like n=1 Tax=Ranitomeya variabilis TaxID=490064 RepID=UPI004056470F
MASPKDSAVPSLDDTAVTVHSQRSSSGHSRQSIFSTRSTKDKKTVGPHSLCLHILLFSRYLERKLHWGEQDTCFPMQSIDNLVKSVRDTMGIIDTKDPKTPQDMMFAGLSKRKRPTFPVITAIKNLVKKEWESQGQKGLPSTSKRRYPFDDEDLSTWTKAPKVDAAVSSTSRRSLLPVEDSGSLQDLLDRKADSLQKRSWTSFENKTKDTDDGMRFKYILNITQKLSITLYSIVFALGIIGNGLVIWIAGFRMKNSINAVWFLHLAIADFLCCASLPLRIAEWATVFSYYLGFGYCILNIFLFNINMTASVLLLTAMSMDRLVSVLWPLWAKNNRTCKVVRIIAAIIWVLSTLLSGSLYYLYVYHLDDVSDWCLKFTYPNPDVLERRQAVRLIRLLTMCVIPFLIIVTSYATIFFKLRKSKRSQRFQRTSRIITAVILCFFICWFPYYIWPLTPWYYAPEILLHIVDITVLILACLNSCINPIIYVFMGQNFQKSFFRSIPSRLQRALGDHPHDLCSEREGTINIRATVI